ncbi:MAG TPA: Hsp20/alpha crystallin family protein [Fimbriimonadaceae bacterium]|nr:Hsp20/alpha crystallin family protein [Fimbriimonadaceae bacterium]
MRRRETEEWFFEIGADLGRYAEELSRGVPKLARSKLWEPRVDVFEDEDRIVIRAEISGVRGEDISLIYVPERNSVLIRGVRLQEEIPERSVAHQLEIYYGEFEREQPLPEVELKPDRIRAHYRNGFLTVVLPKA